MDLKKAVQRNLANIEEGPPVDLKEYYRQFIGKKMMVEDIDVDDISLIFEFTDVMRQGVRQMCRANHHILFKNVMSFWVETDNQDELIVGTMP